MLTDSRGKSFKPAPPKFANELAENGENDPEPAFLRTYIAGDRALKNRRRGELALWTAIGVVAGGCIAVFGYFVPLLWVLSAHIFFAAAAGARGVYLLWDAKMADVESRTLVTEGDFKVRILSDEEVEKREIEKQRGLALRRKSA